MAILFDAEVHPDASTMFVRNIPEPSNLTLLPLFGTTTVDDNEIDLAAEVTNTARVARYRAFDGRIHVSDRDAATAARARMAPFSDSLNRGEYETLKLAFARTGGTRADLLANAIYDDASRLTSYMFNRMELALGDVLTDGVFSATVAQEYGGVLDFGVDPGNFPTAAKVWTDPTADIIGELIAWCDKYEDLNGERPSIVLTSRKVIRALTRNTGIINAVKGAQTGVTRVTMADVADLFDQEGIPTDWRVSANKLDVDGVSTPVFAEDKLTFLPANPSDLMDFRLGISATALELVNSNLSEMSFGSDTLGAAGVVGLVEKVGPPYRQFTFVDAVGLPVLKNAKRLFTADVL